MMPLGRKGMTRHDIKAAIRNRGITVSELSRRISPAGDDTAVSQALLRPWPRVEAAIAEFLGMQPQELWPDRYSSDGQPLTSRSEKMNSISGARTHRLKRRPS